MANGGTAHEHIGTVKSTVAGLEKSPSHRSASSPIYHGGSRATGHGVGTPTTGKLSHGSTRGKPRGTKTHIGKRKMMTQKSKGR
jgi:hypothetical protein